MTTNPTRPRPGTLTATQLRDGTYVVRSAVCCRPEACAPAVGVRCCPSPRCDCPIPLRWLGDTPGAPSTPSRTFGDRRALLRVVGISGALTVSAGALGGIAWGVFQAVAWVVENAVLILGGATALVLVLAGIRVGGGGSRGTFSGIFRGRMD